MTAVNGRCPTGNNGCSPGFDGTGFTRKKPSVYPSVYGYDLINGRLHTPLISTPGSKGFRSLHYAEVTCFQLAKGKRQSVKATLGLKHSAQILLEIIRAAEAFHLLNTVDGGVQGQAIDVNNILRDYITRLNQDFIKHSWVLLLGGLFLASVYFWRD
ncbi:hypothetical protein BYT27DRAFT_7218508 [Phlegmacium glaucopus]|nr:hypothetical protein BYT27DRAFT_7218508 [Phlegmacium glaucopus]